MRLQLTLNPEKLELLDRLREGTYQTRSGFLVLLMAQEEQRRLAPDMESPTHSKRPPGRPRKDGTPAGSSKDEDFPDEHAPRTLILPEELRPYVLQKDRAKLVNEYDITMLEAKKEAHEATS